MLTTTRTHSGSSSNTCMTLRLTWTCHDVSKAFVPGLRRGFALVPLVKYDRETDEEHRARVQEVLKTIRAKTRRGKPLFFRRHEPKPRTS